MTLYIPQQIPQTPLEQEVNPDLLQQSESDDLPESSPELIRQNAQISPPLPADQ